MDQAAANCHNKLFYRSSSRCNPCLNRATSRAAAFPKPRCFLEYSSISLTLCFTPAATRCRACFVRAGVESQCRRANDSSCLTVGKALEVRIAILDRTTQGDREKQLGEGGWYFRWADEIADALCD